MSMDWTISYQCSTGTGSHFLSLVGDISNISVKIWHNILKLNMQQNLIMQQSNGHCAKSEDNSHITFVWKLLWECFLCLSLLSWFAVTYQTSSPTSVVHFLLHITTGCFPIRSLCRRQLHREFISWVTRWWSLSHTQLSTQERTGGGRSAFVLKCHTLAL